jgi:hypothetical protein
MSLFTHIKAKCMASAKDGLICFHLQDVGTCYNDTAISLNAEQYADFIPPECKIRRVQYGKPMFESIFTS